MGTLEGDFPRNNYLCFLQCCFDFLLSLSFASYSHNRSFLRVRANLQYVSYVEYYSTIHQSVAIIEFDIHNDDNNALCSLDWRDEESQYQQGGHPCGRF